MKSFKNLMIKLKELIVSLFSDLFDGISNGIDDGDISEVAKNVVILCIVCSLFLLFGFALVLFALHNSVKLVIIGFLAAGVYSMYKKLTGAAEPEPIHRPTAEDYAAVHKTLKSALAKVAPTLGLAPIHRYTDIKLNPDDMITEHGRVWRLGFGALKKTAGVDLDEDLCKRVIQSQVRSVLERENPAGFSNVRFPYGGTFESIIQIDEVLQDDANIYILAAIASEAYFRQRDAWENQEQAQEKVQPTPQDSIFK